MKNMYEAIGKKQTLNKVIYLGGSKPQKAKKIETIDTSNFEASSPSNSKKKGDDKSPKKTDEKKKDSSKSPEKKQPEPKKATKETKTKA